jgi:Na+/proline symporter
MQTFDYVVIGLFFLLMIVIGFAAIRKIKGSKDFFVGGGNVPWWLAGVSHHVSGYSGVVFVAFAAVAYQYGFTLYIWWACPASVACFLGAYVFAPRWARLRIKLNIESPTEYLAMRYSVATQQLMAWSGVMLKMFDIGAKWAALGVLIHGFLGLPISTGILISGGISLFYVTVGGLWADLYTDFAQFLVQLLAGFVLFIAVVRRLGGAGSIFTIWDQLPESHTDVFSGPFTPTLCAGYVFAVLLSYNGGTWNQATRYIAAPTGRSAKRSALLSGTLYAFWPLVLFFPIWAAPLLLPNLAAPSNVYPKLAMTFLPSGLVGLVLAAMFASTMAMTTSDTNTISSVITRDILPRVSGRFGAMNAKRQLLVARLSTLLFTALTLIIAIEAEYFGGILGLIIFWFAALIGPISIPMLCGLLPAFIHADARAAILSILGGLVVFVGATYGLELGPAARVTAPIFSSALIFCLMAWLGRRKPVPAHVEDLMQALSAKAETPS